MDAPDPLGAMAVAFGVQGECEAHAVPLEASMAAWSEERLRRHFAAHRAGGGGKLSDTPYLDDEMREVTLTAACTLRRAGDGLAGDVWRRDAALRKSHWLCRSCDLAIARETAACATCGAADFSSSELRAEDATRLAARLAPLGVRLRTLDVSHNPMGSAGVIAIVSALDALTALTQLDLAATCAADEGAVALAEALHERGCCPQLRVLSLLGCAVKARGGAAFARWLSHSSPSALVDLGLGWNAIRGDAARELAAAALACPHLEQFCGLPIALLRNGVLPPVPPLSERDRLRRPTIDPSNELHMQGCGCGSAGAFAVASLLPRLPRSLRAIVMPYQDLGDEGAVAIAEAAAAECPHLSFLMLSRNEVSEAATARIRTLIPKLDAFHLRVNNRGG